MSIFKKQFFGFFVYTGVVVTSKLKNYKIVLSLSGALYMIV